MAQNPPSTSVAAITGGTGAIGKAIARQLADKGFQVVLFTRDKGKSERTVHDIISSTGNGRVSFAPVDLSRHTSIQGLRAQWKGPLRILINNAATTPKTRRETTEGIELQFATNVLGYFWIIQAFKDVLIASSPSRIINVASYWAGGLDLDDLEFERRTYRNGTAYRQSKQADRMLTAAFARRLKGQGVTVNACHPGDVNSSLSNDLGFGGHETPDQAAETPVWLATSPGLSQVTGEYFEHQREVHCPFMEDRDAVQALFNLCAQYE